MVFVVSFEHFMTFRRTVRPRRHGGGGHLPLSPRRDIRQTATLWKPLNQATQKGSTGPRIVQLRRMAGRSRDLGYRQLKALANGYVRGTLHLSTQPEL